MVMKMKTIFLLWMVVASALVAQDDEEFANVTNVYPFSGKSEAIRFNGILNDSMRKGDSMEFFLFPCHGCLFSVKRSFAH